MAEPIADLYGKVIGGCPSYIGNGILPKKGRMLVGGHPSIGKSMLMMNLGYDLAAGKPLFGFHHINSGAAVMPCHEPVRVLYVEQEVGREGWAERITALHGHRLDPNAERNLWLHSMDFTLMLDTRQGIEAWHKLLFEVSPHVLIIDPLAQFHSRDENDAGDMGQVLHTINNMLKSFNESALSVVLVHHFGKPTMPPVEGIHRMRGSGAVAAWADTRLEVDAERSKGWGNLNLYWTMRRGKPIPDMTVKIDSNTLAVSPGILKASSSTRI